ncbi:dihydrolipoamide acetyltransferase component of pyruvate dehydrogenase complex [Adhaeribacter aerolatus]|uniref:Dihydrolipoamide acetyltransferase component of pyruvate dehydrogenase complex n=1 Tax=Adhaeribacter aerolatus TaxID=670289 RepID=A0A512B1G9_9BACT|nr:dihydrolipoamide acetyltransferase family protein [Adhaeribacter aerolatus]GEO05828.1 dihydrolipoamide acetyltransferase component of pyruvate dehydrogenase complex [Adhaeribacter aerolatus]
MALVEMLMPKMGESIMEGTILKWLKKVGDDIEADESVLEVATDKVDTEVPAIQAGKLYEILAQEGEVVAIGKPIAIIETESGDATVNPSAHITQANLQDPVHTEPAPETESVTDAQPTPTSEPVSATKPASFTEGRFYSPLVMNIARQEGIPMRELDQVPGTGLEGRVTKHDIMAYLENRKTPADQPAPVQPAVQPEATVAPTPAPAPTPTQKPAAVSVSGNSEIIEMDRMRKMIAQRMVESKQISAHVTSFVEADVTNMVLWRNRYKDAYQKREGEKLTFTPIFIEAVAKAIKDFPMINISVAGDNIIKKRDINIGMAVALPSGNLIVPVIKNADQMNLNGLAKKVNDLANRARTNKLTPDDLSDGTYTISNVGTFGNVMGTPIIVQPQVAILALGTIKKKPAVIETPEGDLIGIRHFMFLSHSYDHRVVDGSLGGMFVQRVAHYLESFDSHTTI